MAPTARSEPRAIAHVAIFTILFFTHCLSFESLRGSIPIVHAAHAVSIFAADWPSIIWHVAGIANAIDIGEKIKKVISTNFIKKELERKPCDDSDDRISHGDTYDTDRGECERLPCLLHFLFTPFCEEELVGDIESRSDDDYRKYDLQEKWLSKLKYFYESPIRPRSLRDRVRRAHSERDLLSKARLESQDEDQKCGKRLFHIICEDSW